MTFRRNIPSLLVLLTFGALTWYQDASFSQVPQFGGGVGVSQPTQGGVFNPQPQPQFQPQTQPQFPPQPPATGVPAGGYTNATPGAMSATGTMLGTGTMPPNAAAAPGQYPSTGLAPNAQTLTGPAPTGQVPTGTTPPADHMISHPLGAHPNGPQPGFPNGSTVPIPNGRQILPPPEGYSLSKEEWDEINGFLSAWHEQSKTIEALDYEFTRREYSAHGTSETYGKVKFRAPDKGSIEIDSEWIDGKKSYETNKKMKIVCTGNAVYQFDFADKKLTEFVIPVEERGKGVMDSPLMILVGANPRELQERFYLLVKNTPASLPNCICLEAWPKWLEDAKEFKRVVVAIDRQTFQAKILLLYEANGEDCKGYEITKINRKSVFEKILPGQLNPFSKDEFERNVIVGSRPRDWAFETKNDFLPDASGQQIARQNPAVNATPAPVYPPYGNQPNNPVNMPTNNTAAPGPGVSGWNLPATQSQGQPGATMSRGVAAPGQVNYQGTPQFSVPNNVPNNIPPGSPQPSNNSYLAMPPQGNYGSQTVIR